MLRELSRLLSLGNKRVVVVVDKSMEIAGTGLVPHPAIGNARVLTVETPSAQHKVRGGPRPLLSLTSTASTTSNNTSSTNTSANRRCSKLWRTNRLT